MKKLRFLPRFLRLYLIRQNIRLSAPPESFQVNIATTKEELEKAYSLLHDCYVDTKLMAPSPSGLRANIYSFLPSTTTVVAKIGDVVVGTLSLIKDSPAGLPSDKDFKDENDQLRFDGHRLVEVSSLAIDPNYRKKAHVVSLYLMKYLQHYITHHMGSTTVSCVIHPRARDFYSAFWGFKANKKIVKYKFVNDALGVHMYGNITDETMKTLESKFPSDEDKNPVNFLFKNEDLLKYPERKVQSHLDPIYTPELLKYFMSERTQIVNELSKKELQNIFSAYSLFFDDLDSLEFFKEVNLNQQQKRQFRFPCRVEGKIKNSMTEQKISLEGHIMDLTQDGAFFATNTELDLTREYVMDFQLGNQKFTVNFVPRWRNRRARNHQMVGYGVEFLQTQLGIARIFKQTHLTAFDRIAK